MTSALATAASAAPALSPASVLEVRDLNKSFGGLVVTRDVSMRVREGEIFGIIGPNGAGKSTLFNLISGYLKPSSGRISFRGRDITGRPPYEICRLGIGRTFQIVKPFGDATVLYNVAVGAFARTFRRGEALARAEEIVEQVGLGKRKDALAKNLTIVDRKRLELARVLATRPTLVLLDEILAGLNPTGVDEAVELIRQIRASGVTVVLIEHVMRAVMALCERVLVIDYGKRIAEGTPEQVTNDPEVITAYIGG